MRERAVPDARAPVIAGFADQVRRRVSGAGLRSLSLIAIVAVVWVIFQVLTNGLFLSSRNLTNLTLQVSITAILAAGIVLLMVAGHIDLSIGASVAFCAIAAAVLLEDFRPGVPLTIVATLLVGLTIGIWQGAWVAWSRVPSFIVTLATLMFLRGFALFVTGGATRNPGSEITFIASYFLPAEIAVIIFGTLFAGFVFLLWRDRSARLASGMEAHILGVVAIPAALLGLVCAGAIFVAISYRGMPLPMAILLGTVVVTWLATRRTRFGRHLYAIGGNPEAARYAGINVARHSFVAFAAMGVLYAVAGLVLVARLNTAPPNAALGLELNVIAAAVIGGTSLLGGVGTVAGAVIGALLMESLNNGMSLINLPSYFQQMAVGVVLLLAVFLDIRGRRPSY